MTSPERVGPLSFIRSAIAQGRTPAATLNEYRSYGGAIRTQRWYAAWGEIAAEAAVRPKIQTAPVNRPPSADEITRVGSRRPGAYLYRGGVVVSVRTVDPSSGRIVETTQTNYGSLRSAQPINYLDAMAALEDKFGPGGQSGIERSSVLGSFITDVNELVEPDE